MAYAKTIQEKALALIAQKMETSLAVEGVLSEQGLAALSESENSIVFELAKALTGKKTVESVNDARARYRQRILLANLALDDDQTVTVATTTTITTATGKATIAYEYITRGRVHVRNNKAVVYVDRNRFDLKNGGVYWTRKKVGWYDRKGSGEINGKPIHIYKSEAGYFVLAELRQQQAKAA